MDDELLSRPGGSNGRVYHRRNVERLERGAIAILRTALGDEEFDVPTSRMSIGARTLGAEYGAYLLAVRRIFDYAARGLALRLANEPAKLSLLCNVLKDVVPEETFDQAAALVRRTFDDLRDPFDRRNFLSHEEPLTVGQFQIVLAPGEPCRIAFVPTDEQLEDSPDLGLDASSLPSALDQQLQLTEDLVFEFVSMTTATT